MRDLFEEALNSTQGRLARVLILALVEQKATGEIPDHLRERLNRLVDAPGNGGRLARARLAAEVALLFDRAPDWTQEKIVPLFAWSNADAADAWRSRRYSNYIGSATLFGLTKEPFLEMFRRAEINASELTNFAEWMVIIALSNQYGKNIRYPLTHGEVRTALRRAGIDVLPTVCQRLALEMEAVKPNDKTETWQAVIGPVFQGIWPLDIELQSHATTFGLAKLLRATGKAFSAAADIVIPFIQPDEPHSHTALYSLSKSPEELYAVSPTKMLDLIAAIVGEAPEGNLFGLRNALERVRALEPHLANTRKFQRLLSYASV